jgi:hypothetical protein
MGKPVNFESANERNAWIIQHADYFVACRLIDRKRERHEAKTLDEARAMAKQLLKQNPKPVLIYAVNGISDTYVETIKS